MNVFTNQCGTDCATPLLLTALAPDQGCAKFATYESQLKAMVIKPTNAAAPEPFTFAAGAITGVVAGEIDNANTDNTKSRQIFGIGGISEPVLTTKVIFDGLTIVTKRTWTVTMTIPNVTPANRTFLKGFQCNFLDFVFYPINRGGNIFHAEATGIEPKSCNVTFPQSATEGDTEEAIMTITYEGLVAADRSVSPI